MKIEITRLDDHMLMEAKNEDGHRILLDGTTKAMRPMQMILTALGGCSTIDIVLILKKQREPIEDIKITIEGERHEDRDAKTFKKIHVHYVITGNVKEAKAKRAIDLSMDKYCSVSKMLEPTVEITNSFEIVSGE
ncbi:MAG: OsmC family protein [Saprospiraceae bacterium]